jgi:hypothetical protein
MYTSALTTATEVTQSNITVSFVKSEYDCPQQAKHLDSLGVTLFRQPFRISDYYACLKGSVADETTGTTSVDRLMADNVVLTCSFVPMSSHAPF